MDFIISYLLSVHFSINNDPAPINKEFCCWLQRSQGFAHGVSALQNKTRISIVLRLSPITGIHFILYFFFYKDGTHKFWSNLKIHVTKLAVLNWQVPILLSHRCPVWQSHQPQPPQVRSGWPEQTEPPALPGALQGVTATPKATAPNPERPRPWKSLHPSLHSPDKTRARSFVTIKHATGPFLRYFESSKGKKKTPNKQIKPLTIFGVSLYCQCN